MRLAFRVTGALAILALCASTAIAADISVTVNGRTAALNPAPVERQGRVLVPLRGVFEQLGASVVYANGQINAQGNDRSVSLHIGSTQAIVDGQTQTLDVAPFIIGASTYVPLRFVAQALGAQVNWDNANRIVAISTAGGGVANQTITPRPEIRRSTLQLAKESPANGAVVASVKPTIEATFARGQADPNSIRMRLDGADVTAQATRSPDGVVYSPPSDLLSEQHNVTVDGKDANGQPFKLGWTFTSGTSKVENYVRDLRPADGAQVRGSFTVSGQTLPNSKVEIDAGATLNVGGMLAFGGDHERIEATADSSGNFSQQIQLNVQPGEAVTLVVTSTEPRTKSSVKVTRHYSVG